MTDAPLRQVSEIEAIGLSARYIQKVPKEYEVTRGKSKVMWRAVIMLISAAAIIALSARFIPSENFDNHFLTLFLLLPRLGAIVLVYMAIVRIRKTSKNVPVAVFNAEGIKTGDFEISWGSVQDIHLKGGSEYVQVALVVTLIEGNKVEIDLREIDEFPEDVAVMSRRYLKKYAK